MIDRRKNTEFGVLLALVLVVISFWFSVDLTIVTVITLLITLLAPGLYTPLSWFWFRFGEGLGFVVSRIILFLLFFGVITPIGWIRRRMQKDPFRLKQFHKSSDSVFILQEKKYKPQDLEKQF